MISAVTAFWILDCGASRHIANATADVTSPSLAHEPARLTTVGGEEEIRFETQVAIPHISGRRDALYSEESPNCASLGRLIIDDGYDLKWNADDGLRLTSPTGE